ncbi:MAG: TolC family protein [Nitrospirae bacterium]|nr:TolC family protein [Nitrospirota bacterium]
MILRTVLILFMVSVISPPIAPAQEAVLSLGDVLFSAMDKNEQIRMAGERLFRAERDKERAISALLPKLTLEGNYTRYPEETASLGASTIVPQSEMSYNLLARLNQPLYEGGKLRSGLRIAEGGIAAGRNARTEVEENILFQTARTFYDVLKAQESLEVEKRNLTRLAEHLRQAQVRLQVGEVTRSVVLRAEAEYAGGEAAVTQAENTLSVLREQLRKLAALPGEFALQRPEASGGDAAMAESEEGLKARAEKSRADLQRRLTEEAVAKERVTFARGEFRPSLSLEGIYFQRGQDPESTFFIDRSWSAAVKMDDPLFEGGLRRADVRHSLSSLREARLTREELEKEVDVEVHNALLALRTAEQVLISREKQTTFARENFEMVSKQFEHGLATNVDVMDANSLLLQAERDYTHAAIEKEFAVLALRKATGAFLESVGITKER